MAMLFHRAGQHNDSSALAKITLPHLESLSSPASSERERAANILRLLRQAALDGRETKSRPFYSIRSVARHFAVPPTTVTRIYGQLKDEGVLCSIWGSRTVVEPTTLDKNLRVRGVVGLPTSLKSFSTILNYRMFFISIRDVLWKLGFATRLVFYERDEAKVPNFADRLLNYNVDAVIWFLPDSKVPSAAARLVDHGTRVVTVNDCVPKNGRPRYYVSRGNAIREVLRTWKRDGIETVTVLHRAHGECRQKVEEVEECLREARISYAFVDTEARSQKWLHAPLPRSSCGAIFGSSDIVVRVACQDLIRLQRFLRERRVMFVEGSIDFPAGEELNGQIDSIEINWKIAARRIATDLLNPTRPNGVDPVVFEAAWIPSHPQRCRLKNRTTT